MSPEGPVPREQREQELEYFLNKQSNELGLRIKSKLSLLQSGNDSNLMALEQQVPEGELEQTQQSTDKFEK